jgi:hypothetical protein
MKKILVLCILFTSLLVSANDTSRKSIAQKELQKQIEKEKKYAKEQKFYQKKEYDLKSMEINPDSLSSIPDTDDNEDDFDMDDVY